LKKLKIATKKTHETNKLPFLIHCLVESEKFPKKFLVCLNISKHQAEWIYKLY